jgi:hypothetical protein
MRNLLTLVAAAALLGPFLVPPAFGRGKPLPSAFGKELVPDKQPQEGDAPKADEIEEHPGRRKHRVVQPGRHGQRGQKLHIQLDGSEGGGAGGGAGGGDGGGDDGRDDGRDDGGDGGGAGGGDGGDDDGEF